MLDAIGLDLTKNKNYEELLRDVESCKFGDGVKGIFLDYFSKTQIDTPYNFFPSKRISGKKHDLDSGDEAEEDFRPQKKR